MFWNGKTGEEIARATFINRKHEMFWNLKKLQTKFELYLINRKHEMFWNWYNLTFKLYPFLLTVNMKCFEIYIRLKRYTKIYN